jgi:hypothetical protein
MTDWALASISTEEPVGGNQRLIVESGRHNHVAETTVK